MIALARFHTPIYVLARAYKTRLEKKNLLTITILLFFVFFFFNNWVSFSCLKDFFRRAIFLIFCAFLQSTAILPGHYHLLCKRIFWIIGVLGLFG